MTISATTIDPNKLPVIIAGAGPCGLVVALTLQKQGIPFVLYERASREKLCSNAGSGFDLAPTAVKILKDKLSVDMEKAMQSYNNLYFADMENRPINTYQFQDLPEADDFGSAIRSDLQNALLDMIMYDKAKEDDQNAILKCGVAVSSYENKDDHVEVNLSDGSTIKGLVLLACDGIHSAVRKHMHRNVNDDLNYCGQECWWGKTDVRPGSDLDRELRKIEKSSNITGSYAISLVGSHKHPGMFFAGPVGKMTYTWAYVLKQKNSPKANQTDDLIRRGGKILTEEAKRHELEASTSSRSKLLRLMIQETPASGITKAGFFDRKNLKLPFVDGRVALLGDAAHPQSPMMGQGANMAIVDGYVVATQLAAVERNMVATALAKYDCDVRRKDVNKVILGARSYGNIAVSSNRFVCWMTKKVLNHMPPSFVLSELEKGDKANKKFLERINQEVKSTIKV